MRKIISLLLGFFLITSMAWGQKKIVLEGDTLIAITPKELVTVNKIIVDLEHTKKQVALQDTMIHLDSLELCMKDSIIETQRIKEVKLNSYWNDQITMEKMKRKKSIFWSSGIGITVGLILGLCIGVF